MLAGYIAPDGRGDWDVVEETVLIGRLADSAEWDWLLDRHQQVGALAGVHRGDHRSRLVDLAIQSIVVEPVGVGHSRRHCQGLRCCPDQVMQRDASGGDDAKDSSSKIITLR